MSVAYALPMAKSGRAAGVEARKKLTAALAKEVGPRIAATRARRNWTQEQLARAVGVTRIRLSRWENGHSLPDALNVAQLCDALQIEASQIFGRRGVPEPGVQLTPGEQSISEGVARAAHDAGMPRPLDQGAIVTPPAVPSVDARLQWLEGVVGDLEPGDIQTVAETAENALALARRLEAARRRRGKPPAAKRSAKTPRRKSE